MTQYRRSATDWCPGISDTDPALGSIPRRSTTEPLSCRRGGTADAARSGRVDPPWSCKCNSCRRHPRFWKSSFEHGTSLWWNWAYSRLRTCVLQGIPVRSAGSDTNLTPITLVWWNGRTQSAQTRPPFGHCAFESRGEHLPRRHTPCHTRPCLTPYYLPIKVLRWEDAVKMRYEGTPPTSAEYEAEICSRPSLGRCRRSCDFAKLSRSEKRGVKFSRVNVYQRDGYRCQYCRQKFVARELSYDHVVPRSAGGRTTWENIVTAVQALQLTQGEPHLRRERHVAVHAAAPAEDSSDDGSVHRPRLGAGRVASVPARLSVPRRGRAGGSAYFMSRPWKTNSGGPERRLESGWHAPRVRFDYVVFRPARAPLTEEQPALNTGTGRFGAAVRFRVDFSLLPLSGS